MSAVDAAVTRGGANWLSAMPSETQNYVAALTGITPADAAAGPPLTIDASTGLPVEDSTNVDALPSISEAGLLPTSIAGVDTNTLLIVGGVVAGLWLLSDVL